GPQGLPPCPLPRLPHSHRLPGGAGPGAGLGAAPLVRYREGRGDRPHPEPRGPARGHAGRGPGGGHHRIPRRLLPGRGVRRLHAGAHPLGHLGRRPRGRPGVDQHRPRPQGPPDRFPQALPHPHQPAGERPQALPRRRAHRGPPGPAPGHGGAGRARPGAGHPARADQRGAAEVGQLRPAPVIGPRHVDRLAVHRRPRRRDRRRPPARRRAHRPGPVPGPDRRHPARCGRRRRRRRGGVRRRRRPVRGGVTGVHDSRAGRLPALFISRVRAAVGAFMLVVAASGDPHLRYYPVPAWVLLCSAVGYAFAILVFRWRRSARPWVVWALIAVDTVLIAALAGVTGGGRSPFAPVLLLVVIAVAIRFGLRRAAGALAWTVPLLVTLILAVPQPSRPGTERVRDALWWAGYLTAGAVLAGV